MLLHEILTTKFWAMELDALRGYRKNVDDGVASRVDLAVIEQNKSKSYLLSSHHEGFSSKLYLTSSRYWDEKDFEADDDVIDVLRVNGPITRGGDGCSYGSMDLRDQLMKIADFSQCRGHLFIINTPGGSADSMYDFRLAIDYAHSKGQLVYALIDGFCASAGYFLAAQCDKIYYVNPKDRVGSIGVYAAFYLQRHGDVNSVTQQEYIELYASQSKLKNKMIREAADGKFDSIQQDLDKYADEFISLVRGCRLSVSEEQLEGGVYEAKDVEGSLVDGQNTIRGCVDEMMQLSASASSSPTSSNQKRATSSQTQANMKNYENIQKALGLEALESDSTNGVYLNESYAECIDKSLAEAETTKLTLAAKQDEITKLNLLVQEERDKSATDLASAVSAHQQEIDLLKSTHQQEMDAKVQELSASHQDALSAKDTELDALRSQLDASKAQVQQLQQDLAAKQQELDDVSNRAPKAPVPSAGDGGPAVSHTDLSAHSIYEEGMTAEEKRQARAARMHSLKTV